MAKAPKQFDVWFVTANTVYKGVPFSVVADWVQEGRLTSTDQLRSASSTDAWRRVEEFTFFADYLPRPMVMAATTPEPTESSDVEPDEMPELDHRPRRRRDDSDDDVDMIPLIDISMVLLVFFIMMRATGALSPVDVPDMQYAGELSSDPNAITLAIEKKDETTVVYSLRVGEQPPLASDANLTSQRETLERLKEMVAKMESPPEVRVACAKDLPSQRVFELIPDLKTLKSQRKIRGFNAEVNEASRK